MSHKLHIFIPGNVPSSKNSKVWTGKFLVSSKTVQKWEKNTKNQWKDLKNDFTNLIKQSQKPYKIGFFFIRDSRRRFDANNISQCLTDAMVKYEWIEDDNMSEIYPVFLGFKVDKNNPGVYIIIMKEEYDLIIDQYCKIFN